jgi:hypothetical protein
LGLTIKIRFYRPSDWLTQPLDDVDLFHRGIKLHSQTLAPLAPSPLIPWRRHTTPLPFLLCAPRLRLLLLCGRPAPHLFVVCSSGRGTAAPPPSIPPPGPCSSSSVYWQKDEQRTSKLLSSSSNGAPCMGHVENLEGEEGSLAKKQHPHVRS